MPRIEDFSWFEHRFNVLIIDPKQILPAEMLEFFDRFPLFKANLASTYEEAEKIAGAIPRWHACIMAVKSAEPEVCAFLKRNTRQMPVLVVIDTMTLEDTEHCKELHVQHVYQIADGNWRKIAEHICHYAALNAFNPAHFRPGYREILKETAQNLLNKPAFAVDDWATNCNMTSRNLRYIWVPQLEIGTYEAWLMGRLTIGVMCFHLANQIGTNKRERIPNEKLFKRLQANYKKRQDYFDAILFGRFGSWMKKNKA